MNSLTSRSWFLSSIRMASSVTLLPRLKASWASERGMKTVIRLTVGFSVLAIPAISISSAFQMKSSVERNILNTMSSPTWRPRSRARPLPRMIFGSEDSRKYPSLMESLILNTSGSASGSTATPRQGSSSIPEMMLAWKRMRLSMPWISWFSSSRFFIRWGLSMVNSRGISSFSSKYPGARTLRWAVSLLMMLSMACVLTPL